MARDYARVLNKPNKHVKIMAKIKKTRILTCIESGFKKTTFVVEMSDDSRWYTTKGGHVAFNTYDAIKSHTNLDNLCDVDVFSYYGNDSDQVGEIDTMQRFVELIEK